ncbi:MAG: restriction endonuclease [Actinomycetota bacterium]|nr:restriction endonuclease [Actinomycetota bacterium]
MQLTDSYQASLPAELLERYRFAEVRNAAAILSTVAPSCRSDLDEVLSGFQLSAAHLLDPGGNKSEVARELDLAFRERGWRETGLVIDIAGTLTSHSWGSDEAHVLTTQFAGETHKIDNFRDQVAVEVEWNAKDGNLDRDLAAFRAMYDAGFLDAAVVITRHHASIKHAANYLARRFGLVKATERFNTSTTTNLERLTWRLGRGDAGGCPVLAVAISQQTYTAGLVSRPSGLDHGIEQPDIPVLDREAERMLEAETIGVQLDLFGDG